MSAAPHTLQSLQQLKLPDLKALCKEHKIAHSRLKKDDLISKLLGILNLQLSDDQSHHSRPQSLERPGPKAVSDGNKRKSSTTSKIPKTKRSKLEDGKSKHRNELLSLSNQTQGSMHARCVAESSTEKTTVDALVSLIQSTAQVAILGSTSIPSEGSTKGRSSGLKKPTKEIASRGKSQTALHTTIANVPIASSLLATLTKPAKPAPKRKLTSKPLSRVALPKSTFRAPQAITPTVSKITDCKALKEWRYPLITLKPTSADTEASQHRNAFIQSHYVNRLFENMATGRRTSPHAPPETSQAFQGLHLRLYNSCVKTEDFMVALRFWISRLHTVIQLGQFQGEGIQHVGLDMSLWPRVVESIKVADGIWKVVTEAHNFEKATQQDTSSKLKIREGENTEGIKTFQVGNAPLGRVSHFVIGATGEVIGSLEANEQDLNTTVEVGINDVELREDWKRYLTQAQQRITKGSQSSLLALVKTKDMVDFPGGIRAAWRRQAAEAGPSGSEAIAIAERIVLTSCMLNSFSGTKRSSLEMDAEWRGIALTARQTKDVELYLPESHQIISVHVSKAPLHPSLAIATRQTGVSEYVLAETGQTVGYVDEGVVPVWRGLLGCDEAGNEVEQGSRSLREFWGGWEARRAAA